MKHFFLLSAASLAAIFASSSAHADAPVATDPAKPNADQDEKGDKNDADKAKEKDDGTKARWQFVGEIDALFLRGNNTIVRNSNVNGSNLGFTMGSEGWMTGSLSFIDFHFDYLAQLGGGGTGLDGTFQTNVLGGIYVPLTESHKVGPYFRIGAGGEYRGNDSYLYSHLDLPEGQLGFSATTLGYSFEAGMESGITIGGRYNTGADQRRVIDGAPMWGGYAQAHLLPVLLRGEYRTYVQDHDSPVPEEWKARICGGLPIYKDGSAAPLLVCFDGSWLHGAGIAPGATQFFDSRVVYTGISIGLGAIASDAKKELASDRPSDDKSADGKKSDAQRAGNGGAPVESPSATPDADDLRRLTREAMSYFGGSRAGGEWLSANPRPVAVVLPFASRLKEPLPQETLDAGRREVENWFLNAQAAIIIDRPAADHAVQANGGFRDDNAVAIAKSLNARYAIYGWIEPDTRAPEPQRAFYTLTVRVLDVTTNAIIWQHAAALTKIIQTSR